MDQEGRPPLGTLLVPSPGKGHAGRPGLSRAGAESSGSGAVPAAEEPWPVRFPARESDATFRGTEV